MSQGIMQPEKIFKALTLVTKPPIEAQLMMIAFCDVTQILLFKLPSLSPL